MVHQPTNDPAQTGSLYVQKRIGLSYSRSFLGHDTGPRHPESIRRLEAITSELDEQGLSQRMHRWEPAPADHDTIGLVHPHAHQQRVREACAMGPAHLDA